MEILFLCKDVNQQRSLATLTAALSVIDSNFIQKPKFLHQNARRTPNTPPRPSEINEIGAKRRIPFMIKSHAESLKKILGAI